MIYKRHEFVQELLTIKIVQNFDKIAQHLTVITVKRLTNLTPHSQNAFGCHGNLTNT